MPPRVLSIPPGCFQAHIATSLRQPPSPCEVLDGLPRNVTFTPLVTLCTCKQHTWAFKAWILRPPPALHPPKPCSRSELVQNQAPRSERGAGGANSWLARATSDVKLGIKRRQQQDAICLELKTSAMHFTMQPFPRDSNQHPEWPG
jgi:hypothetical protein